MTTILANYCEVATVEERIAELLPIISSFDLCISAAPALVYQRTSTSAPQSSVVCGYSLEVNASSDIDLYISTNQVHLLRDLVDYNFNMLLQSKPDTTDAARNETTSRKAAELSKNDSGIDSEVSAKVAPKVRHDEMNESALSLTPFEILLTAHTISVTSYSHKHSESLQKKSSSHESFDASSHKHSLVVRKKSDLDWKGDKKKDDQRSDAASIDSRESLQESSRSSKSSHSYEASVSSQASTLDSILQTPKRRSNEQVVPFVYMSFSQPHTVIHCSPEGDKVEASCFSAVVKGAKPGHVLNDECKVIPDTNDFQMVWLECRPGEMNHRTGIPPALYTVTVTDFMLSPADINLRIERPVKLNLCLSKLKQIESFVSELFPTTLSDAEKRQESGKSQKSDKQKESPIFSVLSKVQHVAIATVQFVVDFETQVNSSLAGVLLTYSTFKGDVELSCDAKEKSITSYLNIGEAMMKTLYEKSSHSLIGPFTMDMYLTCDWCPHSGPAWLPRTLVSMEMGVVPIHFGQEHVMCLETIKQCLGKYHKVKSEEQKTTVKTLGKPESSEVPPVQSLSFDSCDDLRSGAFQYIMRDDCPYLLPDPGEIVFCSESTNHSSAMTWCYPQPRALTKMQVLPVPFNEIDTSEKIQPQAVLQYWDVLNKVFINVAKFSLSEFDSHDVKLSDLSKNVSQIWRIVLESVSAADASFVGHARPPQIVSPISLAACVQVNSCFQPQLVPALQVALVMSHVEVHLENHLKHLGKGTPDKLQPFVLDQSMPTCQEFMTITLDNLHVKNTAWMSPDIKMDAELSTSISSQVVEYRNLLMQSLVDQFDVNMTLTANLGPQMKDVETKVMFEPLCLHIGQGVIHTMNSAIQAWKQLDKADNDRVVMSYYVLCNDTQETMHISQVDTDENIVLQPREMSAYSWRTPRRKQLLHICLEGMGWKWCDPFSLETDGTILRVIESAQQRSSLLIKIKKISNVQKQIIISGQLYVSNRLSQHLEVKVMTPKQEKTSVLGSCQSIASYVMEPSDIVGLKIRLLGVKKPWSHELPIVGEKCKDHRLVKIPIGSESSYIHAWCTVVKQDVANVQQTLVLVTPLFVMRSYLPFPVLMNISTPRTHTTYQVTVEGFGVERELVGIPGDRDHSISFQTSMASECSPPAMLTSGHIEQVKWDKISESRTFEDLCYDWEKPADECGLFQNGFENLNQSISSMSDNHESSIIPNMDITLDYKQLWAGCNTLLIETAPPYLMINTTNLDIVIHQEGLPNAVMKQKQYYVPSLPQERFQLGLLSDGDVHFSTIIELSHEDQTSRVYLPRIQGRLYKTGFTLCSIHIKDKNKVCFLTVSSKVGPSSFRVITVSERFVVSCKSKQTLSVQACVLLPRNDKVHAASSFNEIPMTLSKRPKTAKSLSADPLPIWGMPAPHGEHTDMTTNWVQEGVYYIRFCLSAEQVATPHSTSARKRLFSEKANGDVETQILSPLKESSSHTSSSPPMQESSGQASTSPPIKESSSQSSPSLVESSADDLTSPRKQNECVWCVPVCVKLGDTPTKCAFSVPIRKGDSWESVPYLLVTHEHEGRVYLTVCEDSSPGLCVHNRCPFSLNFGQTNPLGYADESVQEEMEFFTDLPIVPSHGSTFYTFPSFVSQFPTLNLTSSAAKLHLTLAGQSSRHPWSMGIDVMSQNTLFVHIPAAVDVHVSVKEDGFCRHVFIEPVSRAEISAKVIRSRIKGKETSVIIETPRTTPCTSPRTTPRTTPFTSPRTTPRTTPEKEDNTTFTNVGSLSQPSSPRDVNQSKELINKKPQNFKLSACIIFKNFCFILQDESSVPTEVTDVVRMTAENLIILHQPCSSTKMADISSNTVSGHEVKLSISVGKLQVDNQLFSRENFDFPVVLLPQSGVVDAELSNHSYDLDHIKLMAKESLLSLDCTMRSGALETVSVQCKPVYLYLEDKFFYSVLKKIEPLLSVNLIVKNVLEKSLVPSRVVNMANLLCRPVHLKSLTLEQFSVLLSVHASLKLFIATDHAPLTFSSVHYEDVATTADQLTRALVMHYVSGAIYRAGWVVGSLEILGNPTSLVRNISQGVTDMFHMPYSGLTQGPGAFMSGVSQGVSSLFRNVSAGTLYSITNFASSVSRNMDRLSLDYDHLERQEESRRQKPERLSQGLRQGLTGLGISLLGAVAGLADQPIQNLTNETLLSPVQRAAGVVTGVGKGLMGVVAKPIGGAAELVSQTGQGLLHGTGLSRLPNRIYPEEIMDVTNLHNSCLKFIWKMLPSLPDLYYLVAISAQQMSPQTGQSVDVILLLTNQLLFVVSVCEDTQQQALAVSEIECQSPTREILEIIKSSQAVEESVARERVADFINTSCSFTSQPEGSVGGKSGGVQTSSQASQEFKVCGHSREIFVSMFKAAKNKLLGKGFTT